MSDEFVPVRLSHLLRHCAVGAVVRGPACLVVVKDTRHWVGSSGKTVVKPIPYVNGVRNALGIDEELCEPPVAQLTGSGQVDGVCVPAMRFPEWMRCPLCARLYFRPWLAQKTGEPQCVECRKGPPLEQAGWVMVHEDGYLAEIPWHFLAHRATKRTTEAGRCAEDRSKHYLTLKLDKGGDWIITCEGEGSGDGKRRGCGSLSRLNSGDVLYTTRDNQGQPVPFRFPTAQPWLQDGAVLGADPRLVEVSDQRVHSPVTCSALVIPPESRVRKGTVVDRLYRNSRVLQKIRSAKNALARKVALTTLADEFRCTPTEIEEAWQDIESGYPTYGESVTQGILLEREYDALLEALPDLREDEDFVPRHLTPEWLALRQGGQLDGAAARVVGVIDNLVAVQRLREIQVLKGFQRLAGAIVPPDIVGQSAWLPAIELFGEGIFFTLRETALKAWESQPAVVARAAQIHRRFVASGGGSVKKGCPTVDVDKVTPRFLLLHTLAHLVIRQLEAGVGYPAAALRERVYWTAGAKPMAGILVYVAVPDVAGSLGGLAEIGLPQRFLALLSNAISHADWCSLDPVCGEHEGQGPGLLNRAACHACALVPEPSCPFGNVLLDRAFIRGDLGAGMRPFLDHG